ncbi:MAG: ATP-binding protein [Chloracidobacterium sp.]|nr:ATP-binding protein [Chloracidobacterium sp.]
MASRVRDKLIADLAAADFIGRESEIGRLTKHALEGTGGICLLAQPRAGASELLRQVFDRLFVRQERIAPVYFRFRDNDRSERSAAKRFALTFLTQLVAFRRRDPSLLFTEPDLATLERLTHPDDEFVSQRVIEAAISGDAAAASLIGATLGSECFVMIDDAHFAAEGLVATFTEVFARAGRSFVIAGHRRCLYPRIELETLPLETLSLADTRTLIERLARRAGVAVNAETTDLIAVQLQCDPLFISCLFRRAADKGDSLDTFRAVMGAYADELSGGRIGRYFDKALTALPYDAMIELAASGRIAKRMRTAIDPHDIERLERLEIVSSTARGIVLERHCRALNDHLETASRLVKADSRASVIGERLAELVEGAPHLMRQHYRDSASLGIKELLRLFDGRSIARAMIDYYPYHDDLKGRSADEIAERTAASEDMFTLPETIFAADAASFYPPIATQLDAGRAAVAIIANNEPNEDRAVWIAAEIDSKLEAAADTAEFWCDRLEMLAAHCGFRRAQIWLIAPEGFAPDALDILNARGAIGTSKAQFALLQREFGKAAAETPPSYEVIAPMGEDAEMFVVRTIDSIAERHRLPQEAITPIKTAVVEACINAAEHSLSPDRRLAVSFTVLPERIDITVASRGVRLSPRHNEEQIGDVQRRGWGLRLMKSLMDTVVIEAVDDGTRLRMSKSFPRSDA